jgi:predicted glutamine amidotransferase
MLAFIAREPQALAPYIQSLVMQSREGNRPPGCERFHEDGYGVTVWQGDHWLTWHEQCAVWEGAITALDGIKSTIAILHSRLATDEGTINITKLHPFLATAKDGNTLALCHNGSIIGHEQLFDAADMNWANELSKDQQPIDTEVYFRMVTNAYNAHHDMTRAIKDATETIYDTVGKDSARSLNALFSDGHSLLALKGSVLPRYIDYHTLHTTSGDGIAVVSTQTCDVPFAKTEEWRRVNGVEILKV